MKLIDKDALVAEIRKRKSRVCGNDLYSEVKRGLYSSLEIYINTSEVKEVNLDDKDEWKNTGGFGSTFDPDSPDYCPD